MGSLLWSDYQSLGGFQEALAQHAEFVFLNLKSDEQQALKFVIRNLLVPSRGEGGFLSRRSVPYPALVSSSQLNERQRAGTKGLVDRLIKEGLLSVEIDPHQQGLISIPQEALLRRWPRLWELLSEDRRFLRMRDRLDANLKLWISRGRQREDLLDRGIGLAEAQTLLTDFGSQLNEGQIDYIQRSLARHKPSRKVPQKIGLTAIVGLAISAAFVGGERFNAWSKRPNNEQDVRLKQQNAGLAASQHSELEAERGALEIRLKESEQKLGIAQQSADFANSQRAGLKTQLKKAEEKLLLARQNADLANSQRSALEAELKKAQDEKAQLAQQNTNLDADQRSELEAQLKKAEEKFLLAQQNADLGNSQRSALEAELKKAQDEKAQLRAAEYQSCSSQRSEQEDQHSLETQLKTAEEKLLLAQQNADLANSQRSALEAELKKAQEEKASSPSRIPICRQQARAGRSEWLGTPAQDGRRKAPIRSTNQFANSQPTHWKRLAAGSILKKYRLDYSRENTPCSTRLKSSLRRPRPHLPNGSETPEPPASQSGPSEASGEKESLKKFVLGYLRTVGSNDTSLQRPYLGERVNFYGKGVLNSSDNETSPKRYHKWPIRKCEPRGEAKVVQWRTPNMFSVYQPFTWTAADGSRHAHGNSTLYLRVRKNSQGEFQIVYVRQFNR